MTLATATRCGMWGRSAAPPGFGLRPTMPTRPVSTMSTRSSAAGQRVAHCQRQLDTLTELGGTVWGCHAGDTEDGVVKRSYEELARHCEGTERSDYGRKLQAGTAYPWRIGCGFWTTWTIRRSACSWISAMSRDRSDQNPMTRPGGPTEVVGICGHRLRHVHLHGFVDTDHYPPFHAGDRIQWVELFGALRSADYSGLINFEPSTSRARFGAIEAAGAFPERIVAMAHDRRCRNGCRSGAQRSRMSDADPAQRGRHDRRWQRQAALHRRPLHRRSARRGADDESPYPAPRAACWLATVRGSHWEFAITPP